MPWCCAAISARCTRRARPPCISRRGRIATGSGRETMTATGSARVSWLSACCAGCCRSCRSWRARQRDCVRHRPRTAAGADAGVSARALAACTLLHDPRSGGRAGACPRSRPSAALPGSGRQLGRRCRDDGRLPRIADRTAPAGRAGAGGARQRLAAAHTDVANGLSRTGRVASIEDAARRRRQSFRFLLTSGYNCSRIIHFTTLCRG